MERRMALCFLLLLLVVMPACQNFNVKNHPLAEAGVLDLSDWVPEEENVDLRGQWGFYWSELLTPEELKNRNPVDVYCVNGPWNCNCPNRNEYLNYGYATYHLRINKIQQDTGLLALHIPHIYTSYRLWVNGDLLASNGEVGTDASSTRPQHLPKIVVIHPVNREIDLVIQYANFAHNIGGIWDEPTLGTVDNIMRERINSLGFQLFLFGSLFLIGINYLVIYGFRQKEKYALHFGIFCLLCGIRLLITGEMVLIDWLPEFDWVLMQKIEYITFYATIPVFSLFLCCLYPEEKLNKVHYAISFLGLAASVVVILTMPRIFTVLHSFNQIMVIAASLYFLFVLYLAGYRKREGAMFVAIGGTLFLLTILNDILYYNGLSPLGGNLYAIGLIVFIISLSMVISIKFSLAFGRTEKLSLKNSEMLNEIATLNRNLENVIQNRTLELNETIKKLNEEIAERKQVEEQLRIYATTDYMTQTLNRANGMLCLKKQLSLAKRNKWPLTICFIDINCLKRVNDEFGHQSGDDLIIKVSSIIKDCVRESDIVARIGGDEFLVIFPQCKISEAKEIWKRIIRYINTLNTINKYKYDISISHGFAQYTHDFPLSIKELLHKADREMYKEKKVSCPLSHS